MHIEKVWVNELFINTPFIIVSGPAGGGKTTLIRNIASACSKLCLLTKYTTRTPRITETLDEDYFFVSKQIFENTVNENTSIAMAFRYNAYYGLTNNEVDKAIQGNRIPIAVLHVNLAILFKQVYHNTLTLFVCTKDINEIYKRLDARNDQFAEIEMRKVLVAEELKLSKGFDYLFDEFTSKNDIVDLIHNHIMDKERF